MSDIPERLTIPVKVDFSQAMEQVKKAAKKLKNDPLSLFGGTDRVVDWLYMNLTDAEAQEFTNAWLEKLPSLAFVEIPEPILCESTIAQLAFDSLDDDTIQELAEDRGFIVTKG